MSKAETIRRAAPLLLRLVENYERKLKESGATAHAPASPADAVVGPRGELERKAS